MKAWVVPIEAVRASATLMGARVLARLAGEGATLHPNATVQLLPTQGYMATVTYVAQPRAERQFAATIPLEWAPRENQAATA
jgi:hypothetical protein